MIKTVISLNLKLIFPPTVQMSLTQRVPSRGPPTLCILLSLPHKPVFVSSLQSSWFSISFLCLKFTFKDSQCPAHSTLRHMGSPSTACLGPSSVDRAMWLVLASDMEAEVTCVTSGKRLHICCAVLLNTLPPRLGDNRSGPQWWAEVGALMDVQPEQEINLYSSWKLKGCLLLQHNLSYPDGYTFNMPISHHCNVGKNLACLFTVGSQCLRPKSGTS